MQSKRIEVGPRRHGVGVRGPLSAAAAALEDHGGAARGPRGARQRAGAPASARPAVPEIPDPAAVLARLMDLHGSVALARELAALERRGAQPAAGRGVGPADRGPGAPAGAGEARAAGAGARALVEERLADLSAAIGRTFDEPFQRRNKLPGPDEVHAILEQAGAPPGRPPPAPVAGRIWEPFGELAARALGRIRYETRSLREEVAPALRAIGPGAARIERLDASLSAATERGRERVLGGVIPALEGRFVRRLREAAAALPGPARAEDVAAWFAPGAWIPGEIDRMRRAVEAALAHEAGRLLALAEAASASVPA